MIPKDKAFVLVQDYTLLLSWVTDIEYRYKTAKQCALIAVDEIISEYKRMESYKFVIEKEYWQEVKQEIEKL